LNFLKAFQNPLKLAMASFQKWQALCCWRFKRELLIKTSLANLKISEIGPDWLTEALGAAKRNLLSQRNKEF
jgi:hypothetical protein